MNHRSEGSDSACAASRKASCEPSRDVSCKASPSRPSPETPTRTLILVVDDEPMVVRAVSQILTRAGYDVITASGPIEAAARFESHESTIQLLLTDVVMPDGGGRRLAEQLQGKTPSLRVLFMSGFTEHDSVRDERALPAPLLSKPFTASKLEAAVLDALGDRGD